jgi:hypothetical protein
MPFVSSMIWREQKDHISYCYFSLTNTPGFSSKLKCSIQYLNFLYAIQPVSHPPEGWTLNEEESSNDSDKPTATSLFTDLDS